MLITRFPYCNENSEKSSIKIYISWILVMLFLNGYEASYREIKISF